LNIVTGSNLTFFSTSNGPITNYYWDFGDGSPLAYGKTVTHAYVAEGIYSVTLTVTDARGLTASTHETVDVSPGTEIYVEPLPTQWQIGEDITLNIMISDVSNLWCWQAGMTFNSSVLQCITNANPPNVAPNATSPTTAFIEGDFLKNGGSTVWIPNWVTNGTIAACGCSLLNPATPQSGSGVLATVTFKVIGKGNLDIHLADVILVDPNDNEIPVYVAT
jgi:PKD repeat protein